MLIFFRRFVSKRILSEGFFFPNLSANRVFFSLCKVFFLWRVVLQVVFFFQKVFFFSKCFSFFKSFFLFFVNSFNKIFRMVCVFLPKVYFSNGSHPTNGSKGFFSFNRCFIFFNKRFSAKVVSQKEREMFFVTKKGSL